MSDITDNEIIYMIFFCDQKVGKIWNKRQFISTYALYARVKLNEMDTKYFRRKYNITRRLNAFLPIDLGG